MIKMPKKSLYVKFKNYENQIKSPFSIYNKYKKYVACNYSYELVCIDDIFGKNFKSYLVEDAVVY